VARWPPGWWMVGEDYDDEERNRELRSVRVFCRRGRDGIIVGAEGRDCDRCGGRHASGAGVGAAPAISNAVMAPPTVKRVAAVDGVLPTLKLPAQYRVPVDLSIDAPA
jgi:hypothetical protein